MVIWKGRAKHKDTALREGKRCSIGSIHWVSPKWKWKNSHKDTALARNEPVYDITADPFLFPFLFHFFANTLARRFIRGHKEKERKVQQGQPRLLFYIWGG